jgi:hypothetical protein
MRAWVAGSTSRAGLRSLALATVLLLGASAVRAQGASDLRGYGQTIGSPQQERELDGGPGTGKGTSVLDATNPIDLMNRLRRATALDDATPPRDAIDAALSDFQSQSQPASPGSAGVKAP